MEKAFIGLTALLIIGLGWVFYGVAASGAWSEKVMPKQAIKQHLHFAIGCTIVGILIIIGCSVI